MEATGKLTCDLKMMVSIKDIKGIFLFEGSIFRFHFIYSGYFGVITSTYSCGIGVVALNSDDGKVFSRKVT